MIINTILAISDKVTSLFNNILGWGMALFVVIASYLGESAMAFGAVGIAVVIDAMWGIIVAVKQNKFILSHLLRETMNKFFIYSTTLGVVLFIERSINEDWYLATRVVCAIATACELWSICANILIIKPNFPFIKLFRKYLVGEISRKIGIPVGEFEDSVRK